MAALRELELHKAIVSYLRVVLPADAILQHTPNEGKRTSWEQMNLRALGVHAGWPDLAIYHDGKVLFLEVKTPTGRITPRQHDTMARLDEQGFPAHVVRSIDDVTERLTDAGIPTRDIQ